MSETHIYIYGIIDYFQDDKAAEYGFVNLKSVKNQIESGGKDAEAIVVHIHSDGGDVDEGFAIYDLLQSQGKKVVTINEGNAHSIASVIFMAGNERKMSPNASMLIHLPSGGVFGNSDQIEDYAQRIADMKNKIASLYKEYTTLSEDDILNHMKNEKEFNADEAVSLGFATEKMTQLRAVAKFTKRNKKMSEEVKELEKKTQKEFSAVNNVLAKISKKLGIGKTANMVIQDANGTAIDFFEKEEGSPEVGDKANVDGSAAEGEYTLADGTVVTFEKGVVTEVKPADSGDEDDAEMTALKEENERLKQELQVSNEKVTNLEQSQTETKEEVKALSTAFANLKKTVTSNFNVKLNPDNPKGNQGQEPTSRTLFKSKKD